MKLESSYKFLISVTFHKLFNLPSKLENKIVFIDWIRGSQKGVTSITPTNKQRQVIFESISVVLPSTIFYDLKANKFNDKILEIRIMYVSIRNISSIPINN